MNKLDLETREKLIEFFESSDLETILLGVSLIRSIDNYSNFMHEGVYVAINRSIQDLEFTLDQIERWAKNQNISMCNRYIRCIIYWLRYQQISGCEYLSDYYYDKIFQ